MTLGKKLLKLKTQKNLSQSGVANEIGVSQTAYMKWENDVSIPSTTNLLKLSVFFNENLFEFLKENGGINFYNSDVKFDNLITKNETINQEISFKLLKLYEEKIILLENELKNERNKKAI